MSLCESVSRRTRAGRVLLKLSIIGLMAALLLFPSAAAAAQKKKTLSNQDVIDMVQAGLSERTIVKAIKSNPTSFDTDTQTLIYLKNMGISDRILAATLSGGKRKERPGELEKFPRDVGIYLMEDGKPVEVGADVVNYRTGGVAKKLLTDGVDKEHTNGVVNGPNSKTQGVLPLVFLIVTFEGVTPSEYVLVKLDEKSDRREFRQTTGGVIHKSSGPARNAVDFNYERVARHTYRILLTRLAPGEYGFLPPIGPRNRSASASGRIYTFSVAK